MSMTLTTEDLQAITTIVDVTVRPIITEAIEESDQRTAAGFAEVHERIDALSEELGSVKQTVERIERVQQAEIERVDHQESAINKMRKKLKAV